jgi:Na+-driven multidrug efflux pump
MIIITLFQSVGIKARPLLLSLLRKGGLDIPFMFLMNSLLGVNGIVWATPIADCSAMLMAIVLFLPFWKKMKSEPSKSSGEFEKRLNEMQPSIPANQ